MITHDETYRGIRIWQEAGVWFIGRAPWFFMAGSLGNARVAADLLIADGLPERRAAA